MTPDLPRSRGQLLTAVAVVDPERNPGLQRRDVTGDGVPETWCNVFLRMVLALLHVRIPALLANALFDWFAGPEAVADGWFRCSAEEAQQRAELGYPTVGCWKHPTGKHGHVVLVVPSLHGAPGVHVAQAGARNFANGPIEHSGLLAVAYTFFTRP